MSNCSENLIYRIDTLFNIALIKAILFSFGTTIGSSIYLVKYWNSIYFHPNFRVIFNSYVISFIVRALFLGFLQAKLLHNYQTESNLCNMGMEKTECFVLMYPTFVTLIFMGLQQLSMAFERALSIFYSATYYACNSTLGYVLTAASCILSFVLVLHLMWIFPTTNDVTVVCNRGVLFQNYGEYSGNHIFTMFLMSTELIYLAIIIMVALCAYRKNRLLNEERYTLSLAEKFEKARNLNVLNVILPLFLMHSMFSITSQIAEFFVEHNKLSLTSIQFAAYVSLGNFSSLFTLLAPFVLLSMHKRKQADIAKKVDSEDYFKTYLKMWQ